MSFTRRTFFRTSAAAAGLTVGGASLAPALAEDGARPLDPWMQRGELEMSVEIGLNTTIYYPTAIRDLEAMPVIVWGNGTGGFPGVYRELFRHWVSRGMIVMAANTPNPLFGILMRAGLDDLLARNERRISKFYQRIDADRIATSGHSQGGQAAINAGQDERVATVVPIQPGPFADVQDLHSPMLLVVGEADLIVYPPLYVEWWMRDRAEVPMVYSSLVGAGHFDSVLTFDGGGYRGITAAWYDALFFGNADAANVFFGPDYTLPQDDRWTETIRNPAGEEYRVGDPIAAEGIPVEQIGETEVIEPAEAGF